MSSTSQMWLITGTSLNLLCRKCHFQYLWRSRQPGASSGLGLALTKRVLARGDRVIAAVRTPSKLSNVFSDDESSRVNVLEMDVTEPYSQIKGKIDSAVKKWGPVDVLVNNAGLGIMALTEEGG